ncbi:MULTISPECIES: hypothetical protein [unclassified Streptomyces]|uniref:hypothetical protein n=1 Tax=unclassified Streptomyces TaxID=2593676 RepID=UPI0023657C6D|nr:MULTISPECIES: hypothetical protein [unclassified Streptomyces]MDF3141011.1 hypothetical protein [Streptomyces sp. T21Q-yed]WDF36302.1 hypothetical protein PBV52_05700 [Streptomyces sp. T12]
MSKESSPVSVRHSRTRRIPREGWQERAGAETGERHRLEDVSYAPLIVRPGEIVRLDPDYAARARELG